MPELIEKRTRNSKTHSLGRRKFSWDGTIGSIHYEDNGWQEIDNYFEPAVAPWDWQMLHAGYHIRVKEDFTAGQIIEFEKQGETVQFQPMALEWTNDLDQIQPIAMPHEVSPIVTSPEVDLLSAVGMPSHQGTIRWDDAYGDGIDFEWKCSSTRLVKTLEIENLNKLPTPEQYILNGGNPVLRLNLIFDPSDVDIYADGALWDKKVKKQTFGVIEFHKDGEVLWSFMPLRYWGSGTDTETNQGQSVATLEKRGNKLYISIRVPYDWLQTAIYPVFIDTDVDERVSDNDNDGQFTDLNSFFTVSPGWYASAGRSSGTSGDMHAFYRFTGVTIPDGMVIVAAYISGYWVVNKNDADIHTRIYFEDVANAVSPTNYATANAKVLTSNYTDWNETSGRELAQGNSPGFVAIIKELMVSNSYASGNAMMALIRNNGTTSTYNYLGFNDYNESTTNCANLHIEYQLPSKLEGVTKDKDGNAKATCECFLCKDNGDNTASFVDYAQSDGGGNYSFTGIVDNDAQYFVISWKDETPHIFDVTDHVLQPVEE